MITINEEKLKELEAFINEMPVKFGLPLVQFLIKLSQEQNPQAEVAQNAEA